MVSVDDFPLPFPCAPYNAFALGIFCWYPHPTFTEVVEFSSCVSALVTLRIALRIIYPRQCLYFRFASTDTLQRQPMVNTAMCYMFESLHLLRDGTQAANEVTLRATCLNEVLHKIMMLVHSTSTVTDLCSGSFADQML